MAPTPTSRRRASRLLSTRFGNGANQLIRLKEQSGSRRDDPVWFGRRQEALDELALVDGPEDCANAVRAELFHVLRLRTFRPGGPPSDAIFGNHLVRIVLEEALWDVDAFGGERLLGGMPGVEHLVGGNADQRAELAAIRPIGQVCIELGDQARRG